ncbi:MAG: SBBP repeat-containing protein [Sphingobacteriaceae bacterium]
MPLRLKHTFISFKALAFIVLMVGALSAQAKSNKPIVSNTLSFIENKGQVSDQYNKPRTDILFSGTDGQLSFFLKQNGISYQQFRIDKSHEEPGFKEGQLIKIPIQSTFYRIDVNWVNCNSNAVIKKVSPHSGFSTFYTPSQPNGVTYVRTYNELVYADIYKGIDLRWYQKNGHLKYDYIVSPGADHQLIQLEIKGAKKLFINERGELVIETPLGKIIEQAPYVTQNNKTLKSKWVINNAIISFAIEGIDPSLPLIIDPGVRIWGTYYGGTGGDSSLNSAVDANGNVYMAGTTNSTNGTSIATVGSHQSTFGGGQDNAYVVKFNSAGVRQWATYYGGPVREFGLNVAVDNSGNVFLAGHSLSAPGSIVATPGSHQPVFGGIWDAYIAKFNSNGIRQWGSFYGSDGLEHGNGLATDAAGNVYLCGKTDATISIDIATVGSHQTTNGGLEDAFLVKFNSAGVRQWGTFYGGTGTDVGRGVSVDASGNVYLTGWTDNSVPNVIGSPGSHQNTFGGGSLDAFVVKFNSAGVRQWGTQYGGSGTDMAYDCDIDAAGNVYMAGKTSSSFSIGTIGSHQPNFGGGPQDAFLACFNSTGVRQWGTYYGGNGDEEAWGVAVHNTGHIEIGGHTGTSGGTIIATPGSHQPNYGGGTWDVFIAQFEPIAGIRTWGSYYGETGDELCYGMTADATNHFYIVGSTDTNTGTSIASPGSHQPTYGNGWGDAFLAKFYDCPAPIAPANTTPSVNLRFCAGNTTTLNVSSTSTVNWYASPTSTTSLGTGNSYTTPVLSAGTHTYYAESSSCTVSISRTAITITVFPLPNLNIVASPTLLCAGKSTTLTVSGANTYTWDNGANTTTISVSPGVTTVYSVTATNSFNCVNSQTVNITVHPLDPVILTPSTFTSCLTIFGGSPITLTGLPAGGVYSGPNVSGNTLNPTALGVFSPVYTYTNTTNGCVNSATTNIQVFSCMSVNENSNDPITILVYPNPTKGNCIIETLSDETKTISITDVSGKVVLSERSTFKKIQIDLSAFAKGLYIVKIQTVNGSKEIKLIKE